MKIAILKERKSEELRVAASPETVKKLTKLGVEIIIESGAGKGSSISDDEFAEAGAAIEKDAVKILKEADVLFKVQPPFEKLDGKNLEFSYLQKGAMVASLLAPTENKANIEKLAKQGITSICLEWLPRITRAQSMDVLSSQSNLSGYKAVLDAVGELKKVVPMMTTAAGSIKPAKILVLGAGVAGLQAIATAKRLGALVSAFDVRAAVKEQVESLGATFVEVPHDEGDSGETSGGYAKEMSKEYLERQKKLLADTIAKQDIVITTALIPGRAAPILVTEEMLKSMADGSVVVDLAVTAGGNCEGNVRGKTVIKHGVSIIGHENVPSRVAAAASPLFAKNLFNFITPLINKETGAVELDLEDEIIQGSLVTYDGIIVHPNLQEVPVEKGSDKNVTEAEAPKKVVDQKPHLKKAEDKSAKKAS